jgi:MFS family permease
MPRTRDRDTGFFGHPSGLSTLFFTEMWERLSFYGARAFLAIYMATPVALGGRGMSDSAWSVVIALYLSSGYLLSLLGGWVADRFIGHGRRHRHRRRQRAARAAGRRPVLPRPGRGRGRHCVPQTEHLDHRRPAVQAQRHPPR